MLEALVDMEGKEELKRKIERESLICDCGEKVYQAGAGPIESQRNYNRYFEYLECPNCHKVFFL